MRLGEPKKLNCLLCDFYPALDKENSMNIFELIIVTLFLTGGFFFVETELNRWIIDISFWRFMTILALSGCYVALFIIGGVIYGAAKKCFQFLFGK
jgi:hypothetical protein